MTYIRSGTSSFMLLLTGHTHLPPLLCFQDEVQNLSATDEEGQVQLTQSYPSIAIYYDS